MSTDLQAFRVLMATWNVIAFISGYQLKGEQ